MIPTAFACRSGLHKLSNPFHAFSRFLPQFENNYMQAQWKLIWRKCSRIKTDYMWVAMENGKCYKNALQLIEIFWHCTEIYFHKFFIKRKGGKGISYIYVYLPLVAKRRMNEFREEDETLWHYAETGWKEGCAEEQISWKLYDEMIVKKGKRKKKKFFLYICYELWDKFTRKMIM